jgi:hypothetical protein
MSMQCTGGATLDAEGAEKSAEPLRTTEPRRKTPSAVHIKVALVYGRTVKFVLKS